MITDTNQRLNQFGTPPSSEMQKSVHLVSVAGHDWRSDWRIGAAFCLVNLLIVLLFTHLA